MASGTYAGRPGGTRPGLRRRQGPAREEAWEQASQQGPGVGGNSSGHAYCWHQQHTRAFPIPLILLARPGVGGDEGVVVELDANARKEGCARN